MQAAASEAVVAVAASFESGTSGGASLYQRSSLDDRHRRDRAIAAAVAAVLHI